MMIGQEFELKNGDTVMRLRVVDVDVPGDIWVIGAEYVSESNRLRRRASIGAAPTCEWTLDYDGLWETECGEAFTFNDGGLFENNFEFCYSCGRKIEDVSQPDFEEEE